METQFLRRVLAWLLETNLIMKTASGCIFLCSTTSRILLNLRAEHKSHKLTWGLWGGMAEGDEAPFQCLLRELTEEMGFVPQISKTYPFDVYQSVDKNFMHYSFVCVVEEEFNPVLNSESAGYGWFNLKTAPMPLHAGTKKTFFNVLAFHKLELILEQHKITPSLS